MSGHDGEGHRFIRRVGRRAGAELGIKTVTQFSPRRSEGLSNAAEFVPDRRPQKSPARFRQRDLVIGRYLFGFGGIAAINIRSTLRAETAIAAPPFAVELLFFRGPGVVAAASIGLTSPIRSANGFSFRHFTFSKADIAKAPSGYPKQDSSMQLK